MSRWLLATIFCSFCSVAFAAPGYRFQALLDLDQNPETGCALASPAGRLLGHEVWVYALTDQMQVNHVVVEACRDGAWAEVARAAPAQPLGLNQGVLGSDSVEWSLARSWLGGNSELAVQWLVENTSSAAFDSAGPVPLTLAGPVDAPQSIPTFSLAGLALLCAAVVLASRRYLGALRGLAMLALGLALLGYRPGEPYASAGATMLVELQDPANDLASPDAGADLLQVQVSADAERLYFTAEVRDIQANAQSGPSRVLLIGNSLTYSNDLPGILQAVARQAGKNLVTQSVTQGGANLEDLYQAGEALAEISSGHYQIVIMQQGPSSLAASQEDLIFWARKFNTPIRASGARPALYMVWPDYTRRSFFPAVHNSYLNAALEVDGMFIPAGDTWQAAWRIRPSLALYDEDRFHPSVLGSYAAALSMFCELYQQSPVGLPARLELDGGGALEIPTDTARILQESAWATHLAEGLAGN